MKQTYLFIGIIFILLIVGGLFAWQKTVKAPGADTNPPPTPMPPPISQTTPSISKVPAGWKTYKNKEFGFAFDYPGYWTFIQRASKLKWYSQENKMTQIIDSYEITFFSIDQKDKREKNSFSVQIISYPTNEVRRLFDAGLTHYPKEKLLTLKNGIVALLQEDPIDEGQQATFFLGNNTVGFINKKNPSILKNILVTLRFSDTLTP